MLVAKDGRVLFSHAYGLADRKGRIPNTLRTRFRIGSMNKMFTAVAILQLVEAGKVKLTAPLGKYLPDYPNREVATKVTIHQLLTHTGGTGNISFPDFLAHRKELRTHADYVKRYGKRGLEFEPGSGWAYSSYGFLLLGVVIEKVTGQSYYDYVQQHVYAPAGMTTERIAARKPSGCGPVDRIHRSHRERPRGSRTPTRCPTAEPPPAAVTRRSRTSRGSPTRCSATNCSARRHEAPDHRKSRGLVRPARRQIRVRLRRCSRRGRQRLGRPRRRRTGHERGPEDLPEVRLRGRGAGEHRPAGGTANLGVSRPSAAHSALAPRGPTQHARTCSSRASLTAEPGGFT